MKTISNMRSAARPRRVPLLRLYSAAELAAAKAAFYACAAALKGALQTGGAEEIRRAQRALQEALAAYRKMC